LDALARTVGFAKSKFKLDFRTASQPTPNYAEHPLFESRPDCKPTCIPADNFEIPDSAIATPATFR
jgi:hypothetical protein